MKTMINTYKSVFVVGLFVLFGLVVACSSPDELIPFPKEDTNTNQVYKMPDPVLLNDVETAVVDEIQKEYKEHVSQ